MTYLLIPNYFYFSNNAKLFSRLITIMDDVILVHGKIDIGSCCILQSCEIKPS